MLYQGSTPGRVAGFAEQQLGDLLLFGGFQQGIGHGRAGEGQHPGPQLGGEGQRLLQLGGALPLAVDVHHQPGQLPALGEAVAVTHQGGAVLIPDADHQLAPQRQCGLAGGLPLQLQIPLHVAGGGLHCQLPQGGQVVEGEEGLQGGLGLVGHIDLALLEAAEQLLGGEVYQHQAVGLQQHLIRQGLLDPDPGQLPHQIVEALQVLHVEGGVDVDAGTEQLLHILPALLVAAAGGVAVGQLVHHGDGGFSCQQTVQIHLLQPLLAVQVQCARQDGELVEQGQGLLAAVGLHHPDQDVDSLPGLLPHRLQHGVGLADAGGRAEKHLQLAPVLLLQARQQGVRPHFITHPRAPVASAEPRP